MAIFFLPSHGGFFESAIHGDAVPADAIEITGAQRSQLLAGISAGYSVAISGDDLPILIDPPPYVPTATDLCDQIDTAADRTRRAVAGDPLRAVEYDRARLAAEQFAAAGYEGEVPPMVAAWAINGRSAQQAADSILAEAAAYTAALELLRTTRLAAKEQVRALMAADEVEQAQQVVEQTIAAIETAVAGIGNNG